MPALFSLAAFFDGQPLGGSALQSAQSAAAATAAATVAAGAPAPHRLVPPYVRTFAFEEPRHVGVVRARFGASPIRGVPTTFHWEVAAPDRGTGTCSDAASFDVLDDTDENARAEGWPAAARATRRSWFLDVDACALRLVVSETNEGDPVVQGVDVVESARNILGRGHARSDAAVEASVPAYAFDDRYDTFWRGELGRNRWTISVDLPAPTAIDRVRLVLGFDGVSRPRRSGAGRTYAVANMPLRYRLEGSLDGVHYETLASEPVGADGSIPPLRRRLVHVAHPKVVAHLRLRMEGATDGDGQGGPLAKPVVRGIAAYGAADGNPVLSPPWILSVNANPAAQTHDLPGGEAGNDAAFAAHLQRRFATVLPSLRRDSYFAEAFTAKGQATNAEKGPGAGEALEAIEGSDPELDDLLLAPESPPPIVVLSGSNAWEYDERTGPDPSDPKRWRWNPLLEAQAGGLGHLAGAVRGRAAPFIGFCGGAQLLALLEAAGKGARRRTDLAFVRQVLRRVDGSPLQGFAAPYDLVKAWPGLDAPRSEISFDPADPLFGDIGGARGRRDSREFPEYHAEAIRPDAFDAGGPLEGLALVATSAYCGPRVVSAGPHDSTWSWQGGKEACVGVPEVFRSRGGGFPLVGIQPHPEQAAFAEAAGGDPPESVADPLLLLSASYETIVDAYVRFAREARR